MADQNIQELLPRRRKHAKSPSAGTKTYRKFLSFPCSASAQDLSVFDAEQKETNLRNFVGEHKDNTRKEVVIEKCPLNKSGCPKGDTNKEVAIENKTLTKNGCPIDNTDKEVIVEKGLVKRSSRPKETSSRSKIASWGWRRFVKLWKKSPIKKLNPLVVPKVVSRRISRNWRQNSLDIDKCPLNYAWKTFTYAQVKIATNNFSPENLIGKGGYSEVYKGCLANEEYVAIKKLNKGVPEEDVFNFLSEIGIIAHLNHPNTAKMVGYGVEGGAFLVLQLSSLGSLGAMLHNSNSTKLEWSKRYKIMLGVAEGLYYLHECCERRVIHRDIKADNILLSEDFEPQICDFGLSKWLPKHWSHHNATKFEGTFGYFAPEYFMHGIVDEKIDIFSFGVLLLEIITGRQALDDSQKSLVFWAKPLLDKKAVSELVDPRLENEYVEEQMDWVINTATLCIQQSPVLRPRMSQVTRLLRGVVRDEKRESPKGKQSHQRTYSEELSYVEEYNSTKCLIDLTKHHKIQFD